MTDERQAKLVELVGQDVVIRGTNWETSLGALVSVQPDGITAVNRSGRPITFSVERVQVAAVGEWI